MRASASSGVGDSIWEIDDFVWYPASEVFPTVGVQFWLWPQWTVRPEQSIKGHSLHVQTCRLSPESIGMLREDGLEEALQIAMGVTPPGAPPILPESYSYKLFSGQDTTPVQGLYESLSHRLQSTTLTCDF